MLRVLIILFIGSWGSSRTSGTSRLWWTTGKYSYHYILICGVADTVQECKNYEASFKLLSYYLSFCQGLPGTLHDLNGELLVSFQSCTYDSSIMTADSEPRTLCALSLSYAVSCNLPPWSLWGSWDARIQGKYSVILFLFAWFEIYMLFRV